MKIAVLGGAGVRTVIFINGLLERCRRLRIDTVALYDIDQEKLAIIGKLCQYAVERKHGVLRVELAGSARDALTGADYVVTTLRVGGDHARVVDESIALEQNVIGQETTGAGGFSMAVRTIPVLLDYCALIRECAPDAWIFNFTNPSGLVTQALRKAGFDKVIGICDAPSSTKFRMANYLGVAEDDLYVEFFGLNHLSWIRSVKVKEAAPLPIKEASPLPVMEASPLPFREILDELLRDDDFLESVQEFSMFDPELIRNLGLLPNEYLYYYYHREKALANILRSGAARGKTIEEVNIKMLWELKSMDIDANPEEALQIFLYYMAVREHSYMSVETGSAKEQAIQRGGLEIPDGMGYAGVMLDCIEGLQSKEAKYLVLSVENRGCIEGLAADDVIEVTCGVSQNGIQPVPIGHIPRYCRTLINTIKTYEKLTIEAIEERSAEKAIWALTAHPLVSSYSIAKKLVGEYEKAYNGLWPV